jgi:hypothetical protein
MIRLLTAATMLMAALPGVAAAQQAPQRPAQQRAAQAQPASPSATEMRRQFCDHSEAEVESLISSINAAFRGRQAAQRELARLSGRPGADDVRQRADHWRSMIDELSDELQKWALVRAGLGCPAFGQ